MLRTAARALRVHRARVLMAALSIVLGVAFVVGSLLYSGSVRAVAARAQEQARTDLSVQVSGSLRTGLGVDLVAKLRAVPGVAAVRPVAEGRVFLVGGNGTLVGDPSMSAGVAYVAGPDGTDPWYRLTGGRPPRDAGEVAVETWSARRAGWKLDDRVRVVVGGATRHLHLVGIFTAQDARLVGGGTLAALDAATARKEFAPDPASWTAAVLTAAPGVTDAALARRVEPVLPRGVTAATRADLSASGAGADKLESILLAFAAVALFVSVFLVANTFTVLTAARAHEHALLRAVGASRRYVLRQVLAEALLLAAISTTLGYLLGIGVAAGLGRVFAVSSGPPVPLRLVAVLPVLAAVVVGFGVTMLAAWLPARRAGAVPPIAALRTAVPPTARSLRRRTQLGVAVTGLGAAVTALADENLLYLGAPLLMTGLIILTPFLGLQLTALLRRPLHRLRGILGTLAVENVRRNPRRTATTASTLMVGLAICAAVTLPIASLSAYDERHADTGDAADLTVSPVDFAEVGADTAARIAGLPDVQAVTPVVTAQLGARTTPGGVLDAAAVDPLHVRQLLPVTVREGSLDRLGEGVAISRTAATAHGWRLGSVVTAGGAARLPRTTLPVVALYDAPASFRFDALLPLAKLPGGQAARPASVLVKTAPGRAGPVQAAIRRVLDNPALLVQTRAERKERLTQNLRVFRNVLYALLSVSVLIGALGVVNTMTMAVLERVREIGLLRAIGLDRRQVATVLRLEAVIIALLGALVGLGAGCAIGIAAVHITDEAPLVMPWQQIGALFTLTVLIGVVASVWPARRAAGAPLLEALRSDTE